MNTLEQLNNLKIRSKLLEAESPAAEKISQTLKRDFSTMKSGEISIDQVIEKLNTIRSGKSFKDDAIKASLEEYFNALNKPEKIALLAFMKGIAQIVTGEVIGDKAIEPSDPAPSVTMKKVPFKKVIKPTIIKKDKGTKEAGESKAEDTTPPTPAPIKAK